MRPVPRARSLRHRVWRAAGILAFLVAESRLRWLGLTRRLRGALRVGSPIDGPRTSPTRDFVARGIADYGLTRSEVALAIAAHAAELPVASRPVELPPCEPDTEACADLHAATGFWPIGFSHPALDDDPDMTPKLRGMSRVVPGFPYGYAHEDDYVRQYAESQFALTFRKGGWDCFRHVEIIAAGAVPVMLGIDRVPSFAMLRYPKRWMSAVTRAFRDQGPFDATDAARQLRSFASRHLSTRSTARYVLETAEVSSNDTVLFLDPGLPDRPDYLSMQILTGLKQELGDRCVVPYPVEYLYSSFPAAATASLYGRGFGYARRVDDRRRHPCEIGPQQPTPGRSVAAALADHDPTTVIVGSLRSAQVRDWLSARSGLGGPRVIVLHGEDAPPTADEQSLLHRADLAFVREFY